MRPHLLLAALVLAPLPGCREDRAAPGIPASGHVEATEVRVAAKVGGRVEALPIEEGDAVTAGQEIARQETTDARLALDAARAERAAADAELRLRLAGARAEEIAEARAGLGQAEADLEGARLDLERMEALLASGSGTPKSRDDARVRRDVAAGRRDAARERLRRLEAGFRREEIDAARARVEAADARIAQLQQAIADASIASPVSGVVTEKLVEQGELLTPGTPVAVVTDLADAWLTVWVGETDLPRIRIGQEAEVRTDDGQVRAGRVRSIASEAEFTPKNVQTREERVKLVYEVKIALDNADGLFKPGMPAEARLAAAEPSR